MSLYDYQCRQCGETFEVQVTIKENIDGLALTCPKCGNHEARQLLTAAAVLHGGSEVPAPVCGPDAGMGCCG